MKFHWGLIVLIIVAYFVGVKFAGPGNAVLGKIGL